MIYNLVTCTIYLIEAHVLRFFSVTLMLTFPVYSIAHLNYNYGDIGLYALGSNGCILYASYASDFDMYGILSGMNCTQYSANVGLNGNLN